MERSGTHREFIYLGGILLLALFLRIWGLNSPLWYDEILTLQTHVRLPWGDMMQSYSMNHHYLFSLQAKASVAIFGEAAWSLRLPAMLFGLASIAAVWWLVRDLAGSHVAHITALLLAISFHHIWFSQNARGYTELAFWSALAMVLFLQGVRKPSWKIWIGYSLCMVAAIATHLTGVFFFMAQGLVWLFVATRALPAQGIRAPIIVMPALGYILGGILTLLFYAPLLPSVFETAVNVAQTSSADVMKEYQSPLWSVIEAVRTGIGSAGPMVGIVALFTLTLIGLGAVSLWAAHRLFVIIVFVHIGLTIAMLMAMGMHIWPRFFFVDIGFLMLMIVLGVRSAAGFMSRYISFIPSKSLYALAVAGMLIVSGGLASRNYMAPKQDLEGAVKFVQSQRMESDRIYTVGVGATVFNGYYQAGWQTIDNAEQFALAMREPGSVYLIVIFPARYLRVIPELNTMADDGAITLVKRFPGTLGDGSVLVFRRE